MSDEVKSKISLSHKGSIPWNKDRKMDAEFCKKVSGALKGKPGHKHTPEAIEKIKLARARQAPFSKEARQKMMLAKLGPLAPTWKGGVTFNKNYVREKKYRYLNKKFSNGGSHTFQQWEELKEKYQHMCLCCKKAEPEIKLTEDHIIPISKGGTDDISNIQPLCMPCNRRKWANSTDFTIEFVASPLNASHI